MQEASSIAGTDMPRHVLFTPESDKSPRAPRQPQRRQRQLGVLDPLVPAQEDDPIF